MQIYVDADACPVVDIVEKIAKKYQISVTLLCDTNHILTSGYSEVVLAHSRRCCLVSLFSFCVSCFKGIAISFGNNTPLIESIPCLQAVRYVFYGRVYSIICSLVHITLLCLHYK